MGHFGHTYLPMSDFFYTMPITYLLTPKSDVLYERSLRLNKVHTFKKDHKNMIKSQNMALSEYMNFSQFDNIFALLIKIRYKELYDWLYV